MEVKLWLPFLLLHVMLEVQPVPQPAPLPIPNKSKWVAMVPKTIPALLGSCVVIPCSYTYPKRKSIRTIKRWRGFWRKGTTVIATSMPEWKLPLEYKKRTQLLGDLRARNCTMLMDGLKKNDTGPFYFRIEMPQFKSYSYIKNSVTINITNDAPVPTMTVVQDGGDKEVTATCAVSHTCPSVPPVITWSRDGKVVRRQKRLNTITWRTTSTLTFGPRLSDYKQPLSCSVRYRGRQKVTVATSMLTP